MTGPLLLVSALIAGPPQGTAARRDTSAAERAVVEPVGWELEGRAQRVARLLSVWSRLLEGAEPFALDAFPEPLVIRAGPCFDLPPREASTQGLDPFVLREFDVAGRRAGGSPIATARALRALLPDAAVRAEIHVTRARGSGEDFRVEADVHAWTEQPPFQMDARVESRWAFEGEGVSWTGLRLLALRTLEGRGQPLFADVSERAFDPALYTRALAPGMNTWRGALDVRWGLPLLGHTAGVALGDVDGDGREDLYLTQPGGLPNRLLLGRRDGRFADGSTESGADFLDVSRSALLIEGTGDGALDLVVTLGDTLVFAEGDGRGHFRVGASLPVPSATSLAAADADLDGDLEVYACAYSDPYGGGLLPRPYHDARNGQENVLVRNEGAGRWVDATRGAGLSGDRRFSFAAAWEDVDLDGDPDLYVANDFGRNALYENLWDGEELRFEDVASELGVEDVAAGMGVSWGDVDRDGDADLLVSNMFSSAGRRVSRDDRFLPGAGPDVRALFQRHSRGNSLYLNEGGGFRLSEDPEIPRAGWAWGAVLSDLNGDGWLDVFSPNGLLTQSRDDDL